MRDRAETATLRTTRIPSLSLDWLTTFRRAAWREAAYALLRPGLVLGEIVPRCVSAFVYEHAALCAYACAPALRRRAEANVRRALPSARDPRASRRVARRCFRAVGRAAADIPRLRRLGGGALSRLVDFRGLEHLDAALCRGRGVIGVAPHLGNWEVLAAALAARGTPLTALAADLYDARLSEYILDVRGRWGVATIVKGRPGAMREALAVLRRGEMLGALVDLHTRDDGATVSFLGRESRVAAGPVRLALRTGAAVVPMAIARTPSGRYAVEVQPPLDLAETGDPDADLTGGVRRVAAAMEAFILRWPEQWLWMHDRWPSARPGPRSER
jgi:KDO2-lipid IV(A) lauroyltransferase